MNAREALTKLRDWVRLTAAAELRDRLVRLAQPVPEEPKPASPASDWRAITDEQLVCLRKALEITHEQVVALEARVAKLEGVRDG